MLKVKQQEDRERRIELEIIADAHDDEERAMGWYSYLEEQLRFPFLARCVAKRAISPLHVNDEVEVIGMGPGEECEREMFVTIQWDQGDLAVPLSQLKVVDGDNQTREAVEDWHYWVGRGYDF